MRPALLAPLLGLPGLQDDGRQPAVVAQPRPRPVAVGVRVGDVDRDLVEFARHALAEHAQALCRRYRHWAQQEAAHRAARNAAQASSQASEAQR